MSIWGEYARVLEELIDFLGSASPGGAAAYGRVLEEARPSTTVGLSSAATRLLELLEAAGPDHRIDFEDAVEQRRYEELTDKLASMARIVLGA